MSGTNMSSVLSELSNQSPFQGSLSGEKLVPGVVPITLLDAIDRGLKYNLGLYTSSEAQETVRAARLRSLAGLLPSLSARAAESVQQINLAAFGFSLPGAPTIVGPFAITDIRAAASAPVIDMEALNKLRFNLVAADE